MVSVERDISISLSDIPITQNCWKPLYRSYIQAVCCCCYPSAVIFRCWTRTDKCEKGACGCPHQFFNLIHNGLLCPPHLPSALSWALHRVGIVLNRLLNSLDSQSQHTGGITSLGQKTATVTLPPPGRV